MRINGLPAARWLHSKRACSLIIQESLIIPSIIEATLCNFDQATSPSPGSDKHGYGVEVRMYFDFTWLWTK